MNIQSRIFKDLECGCVLTVKTCWRRFGTTELRHYISLIRKQLEKEKRGRDVEAHWQKKNGKRYCAYWLVN